MSAANAGGHGMGEAKLAGYLVEVETPDALAAAAEQVRDAGYTRWDAHSPFPVHGLDTGRRDHDYRDRHLFT